MELNGQLCNFELVDLLQMIGLGRNTGTLIVRGLDEWVALVILGGKLERVLSQSIHYETFGELLVESGYFDSETLADILLLQENSQTPRRLGEILKDYGVNNNCIQETVFSQIRSLTAQLLAMKLGTFSLHLNRIPSDKLPSNVRQIRLDQPIEVMDLLLWAVQELDELNLSENSVNKSHLAITTISNSELEALVERLAYVDEAVLEAKESNSRFQLSLMRAFWAELRACQTQEEVLMLLLRAAGNVAGRGVLVQIDNKELYNLGSYNRAANSSERYNDEDYNEDMLCTDSERLQQSILGRVLSVGQTIVLNWPEAKDDNQVDRWLWSRLAARPVAGTRAFLIPVESEGGTLVLYGDNAGGQIDFNQLAELEVMLTQVALTLERLRLVRGQLAHSFCPAA